jgi:hypothetical protein
MIPRVHRVTSVEKIRDGGSLAATFTSDGGEYILFIKVRIALQGPPGGPGQMVRLGFDQPVLIDCDPKMRPADTDDVVHSALNGPSYPVSWNEARELLCAISRIYAPHRMGSGWLREMVHVVNHEGQVSPTAARLRSNPPGVKSACQED